MDRIGHVLADLLGVGHVELGLLATDEVRQLVQEVGLGARVRLLVRAALCLREHDPVGQVGVGDRDQRCGFDLSNRQLVARVQVAVSASRVGERIGDLLHGPAVGDQVELLLAHRLRAQNGDHAIVGRGSIRLRLERLRVLLGKHELRIPVGELGLQMVGRFVRGKRGQGHERNGQCRATHK